MFLIALVLFGALIIQNIPEIQNRTRSHYCDEIRGRADNNYYRKVSEKYPKFFHPTVNNKNLQEPYTSRSIRSIENGNSGSTITPESNVLAPIGSVAKPGNANKNPKNCYICIFGSGKFLYFTIVWI